VQSPRCLLVCIHAFKTLRFASACRFGRRSSQSVVKPHACVSPGPPVLKRVEDASSPELVTFPPGGAICLSSRRELFPQDRETSPRIEKTLGRCWGVCRISPPWLTWGTRGNTWGDRSPLDLPLFSLGGETAKPPCGIDRSGRVRHYECFTSMAVRVHDRCRKMAHAAMLIRGQPTMVARRDTTEWHLLLARLDRSSITWRGSTWDLNMIHIRMYIYVCTMCFWYS
jgi:hypothetical protein